MNEREQQRKVRHRLAVLRHAAEVTGNVSATCRYYGISRPTFYKWLNRFDEVGEEGLRDGSCRPHHSPGATHAEIVGKIIYLRQHYHFGPRKISMYLLRYDIAISPSGVWRILKRARDEPVAGLAALQAPRLSLEALREAAPGQPAPGRREVHRAHRWGPQEALPVHRHRRLHPA